MLGNDFDENEALNRSGWRRFVIPVIGGIIVIGLACILVWQFLPPQPSVDSTTTQTPTTTQTSGQQNPGSNSDSSEPVPLTPVYQQIAKQAIAQAFHLTVDQLRQKLQALPPNRGLFGVAQEQGISTNQLHMIIINAQQKASDQMVSSGTWTQAQSDANMQYWNSTDMKFTTGEIESWFQNP